jgi:hypothetical protein
MKLINCPEHGEVVAIQTDSILLRYKCSHCIIEEQEEFEDNNWKDE